MMSEPLEREIDEELRKKQLKSIWDRFGIYLIGLVIVVILSVGGYETVGYINKINSEKISDQFEYALELVRDNEEVMAKNIFIEISGASTGYGGLSLFNLSNLSYNNGNYDEALMYLKKASQNEEISKKIRDFAILRSGFIMLEKNRIEEIEETLGVLLNDGAAFSFHAKEIIALAYHRDGRYKKSSEIFKEISNDASAPSTISVRAKIFSSQAYSYEDKDFE
ncbi:MAG: hypothetical protein CML87_06510 [Rhodobiaceae bacterium]|nr:hypothetical protein [Rhodobiaceae bacterium]